MFVIKQLIFYTQHKYLKQITSNDWRSFSINNRGLNFGDGFFTTILVQNNKVCDWSFHCDRIQTASNALLFPTIKLQDLKNAIDSKLIERKSDFKRVIKIIFTRGNSNQGYGFEKTIEPVIFFHEYLWPEKYIKWQRCGIELQVSSYKLGLNPHKQEHTYHQSWSLY